jgi:IS5 family transposase
MATPLSDIWQHLQLSLLPMLQEELGSLNPKDQQLVEVISLLDLGRFLAPYRWNGVGRPPHERAWFIHAFIAMQIYQFPNRQALVRALREQPRLRRLCGWELASDIPDESTFCRVFARFAQDQLAQILHQAMIQKHCGPKLAGHLSCDATAIAVPERPVQTSSEVRAKPSTKSGRKPGRPKKGQEPPPPPPTRLELQPQRTLAENLADLPQACSIGAKKGSKGHMEYWRGYKLHLGVIDGDIPVASILTGAHLHDSQVAIPLLQMSRERVRYFYDLMDSAYNAQAIHDFSRALGHVPIIEPVKRGNWLPLDPAQRQRFGQRSASERVNGRLKDFFGGRTIRVRGAAKVMCHLMFGVLSIAALSLWERLC